MRLTLVLGCLQYSWFHFRFNMKGDITVQEKNFHIMQNAAPNEVGSVLGLLNHDLLRNPEGEAGYFRKILRQSSVQTEATSQHNWVIYYVVYSIHTSHNLVPQPLLSIIITVS